MLAIPDACLPPLPLLYGIASLSQQFDYTFSANEMTRTNNYENILILVYQIFNFRYPFYVSLHKKSIIDIRVITKIYSEQRV